MNKIILLGCLTHLSSPCKNESPKRDSSTGCQGLLRDSVLWSLRSLGLFFYTSTFLRFAGQGDTKHDWCGTD